MGVRDFSCFITRDLQTVISLESLLLNKPMTAEEEQKVEKDIDEGCTADTAVIVLVPKSTVDLKELDSWPLCKFTKYEKIEAEYDCDTWNFETVDGYYDYCESVDFENCYIWESPSYPDHWLVNFEKSAYYNLVVQPIDPLLISSKYYEQVLDSRGLNSAITNKIHIYALIINNGFADLS